MFLFLIPILLAACGSQPTAVEEKPVSEETVTVTVAEPVPPEPEPEPVEPENSFSQEQYDTTLTEVKQFIESVNRTISSKNYNNWKNLLSDDYFKKISSPEFLANASESPLLKTKKIVLKTPNDYFVNVVVPARVNSRVDEIEFVTENRVKAFYVETRTVRGENNVTRTETRNLQLNELIKIDGTWKIAD